MFASAPRTGNASSRSSRISRSPERHFRRYASGIKSETFRNDTRNHFFLIRGLTAEQRGYHLDNLQLFSQGFATFRVGPFGLERIEVLRGRSSLLYGGSNPGGLLNAVTKKPLFTRSITSRRA